MLNVSDCRLTVVAFTSPIIVILTAEATKVVVCTSPTSTSVPFVYCVGLRLISPPVKEPNVDTTKRDRILRLVELS